MKIYILILVFCLWFSAYAQDTAAAKTQKPVPCKTDTLALKKAGTAPEVKRNMNKAEATEYFLSKGYAVKGPGFELQGIEDGRPVYYWTRSVPPKGK